MRDPMDGWFLTPEQAREIGGYADRHGLGLDALIEGVLATVGDRLETHYLFQKLAWQSSWLLAGLPPERAPYLVIYQRYGVNPLGGHLRKGQVDMPVSEFVEVHLPAAFDA